MSLRFREAGAECFLDDLDIEHGEDFEEKILGAMRKCSRFVVLLTPWALERPYIWMEIGAAWGLGKRVIGVLYGLSKADLQDKSTPVLLQRIKLIDINDFDEIPRRLSRENVEGS